MWIFKKNIGFCLITFCFITCNGQQGKNINEYSNDITVIDSVMIIENMEYIRESPMTPNITLYELYSRPIEEEGFGHWGGITSWFSIGDNTINISWNANCGITFKSVYLKDKIILYWNIEKIDGAPCEGYFNLFRSIKAKSPVKNEKFAEMSLLNDTTILVTYTHKEWVYKINYVEPCCPEFLFPDTLHYYKSW